MSVGKEKWYALDVDIEPQAHEAVEYALSEAGAAGSETATELTKVTGYFNSVPDRQSVRDKLLNA